MPDDKYVEIKTGSNYERVIQSDGVRTTVCANRFEVIAHPSGEINEQNAVQHLREWIRWRKEEQLRQAGDLSG